MTSETKEKLRRKIESEGWNIIWACGEMPHWDEKVELIYDDMDGHPCVCDAIYVRNKEIGFSYFERADGARMVKCIAWKRR